MNLNQKNHHTIISDKEASLSTAIRKEKCIKTKIPNKIDLNLIRKETTPMSLS